VREEIDNTLALIHYHLRNHRIIVVRQFAPEVPLLHADRQQLRQVFLNLLTNASDAMPQGGTLTLGVTAGVLEPGRPAVVIEVTDTGVGIAPQDMPRVLEPFFTTKAEGKGTGLVVFGRNNPSPYTVNGRPLYVHLNGLAIVLLK